MRTIAMARRLGHWIVETPKPARAFLKSIAPDRRSRSSRSPRSASTPMPGACARCSPPRVRAKTSASCPTPAVRASPIRAPHWSRPPTGRAFGVVPLVGPSSLLLALMASGMNGQRFEFHGYLPVKSEARVAAVRALETASRSRRAAQLFIETPYRNAAMLETLAATLAPATRLCVAVDLTLPTESVATRPARDWRGQDFSAYAKRPAIFLIEA